MVTKQDQLREWHGQNKEFAESLAEEYKVKFFAELYPKMVASVARQFPKSNWNYHDLFKYMKRMYGFTSKRGKPVRGERKKESAKYDLPTELEGMALDSLRQGKFKAAKAIADCVQALKAVQP